LGLRPFKLQGNSEITNMDCIHMKLTAKYSESIFPSLSHNKTFSSLVSV